MTSWAANSAPRHKVGNRKCQALKFSALDYAALCVCGVKTNLARICICLYKYLQCCVCDRQKERERHRGKQREKHRKSKHIAMWSSSARLWQQICVRRLKLCLPTVCLTVTAPAFCANICRACRAYGLFYNSIFQLNPTENMK